MKSSILCQDSKELFCVLTILEDFPHLSNSLHVAPSRLVLGHSTLWGEWHLWSSLKTGQISKINKQTSKQKPISNSERQRMSPQHASSICLAISPISCNAVLREARGGKADCSTVNTLSLRWRSENCDGKQSRTAFLDHQPRLVEAVPTCTAGKLLVQMSTLGV